MSAARSVIVGVAAACLAAGGAFAQQPPVQVVAPTTFAQGMTWWNVAFQRLVSAVKVDSRSTQFSGDQRSAMVRSAHEGTASAQIVSDSTMKTLEAHQKRNFQVGQGYNMCRVTASDKALTGGQTASEKVRSAIGVADEKWIRAGGDQAAQIGPSMENRQTYYCSGKEVAQGLCNVDRPGGYPAGDSNAGVFMARRSYGSEEVMTAADFIDVAAPLPTVNVSPADLEGDVELSAARRRAAIVSGARQALFDIVVSGMEGEASQ